MKTKFDYIGHHQQAYNAVLSQIPTGKGHRNAELLPKAAWHAVKLGMDEADFADQILDASAGSDPISQSEIYRAFKTASEKIRHTTVNSTRRIYTATQRMASPDYVPHLIQAGGHSAHAGALRAISPVDVESLRSSPNAQTVAFLNALWQPKDNLHIFTIERPSRGKPGSNLLWQEAWVRGYQVRTPKGDGIIANPFTGNPSVNSGMRTTSAYSPSVGRKRMAKSVV